MKRVILESPFDGKVLRNILYARACVRDSLMRGEAPIASHLLYTQPGVLDDNVPSERVHGIDAGVEWRHVADGTVVYTDFGISGGMRYGIEVAKAAGKSVEMRALPAEVLARVEVEAVARAMDPCPIAEAWMQADDQLPSQQNVA